MVAEGTLLQQLKVLLSHPQILKAGHLVDADLGYFQSACKGSSQFVGGLNLAKYAKDQWVVNNAQCSLADLCAWVLGKWLNKNVSEQLSDAWEDDILTSEQLQYAARDASASLIFIINFKYLTCPNHFLLAVSQVQFQCSFIVQITQLLLHKAELQLIIFQGPQMTQSI